MVRFCSICARGGSKGVPGKNIRSLHGKPLIAHSIAQARESGLFDLIYVSSDDAEILKVAANHGADEVIHRPEILASDQAPKIPAIRHAMLEAEVRFGRACDIVVDLDATSPLRQVADIVASVDILCSRAAGNVFSVTPSRKSPYFNLVELDNRGVPHLSKELEQKVSRRQDSPKCFDINGSVYVWTRQTLLENDFLFLDHTQVYVMPEERSIDIDTPLDFLLVEKIMTLSLAGSPSD